MKAEIVMNRVGTKRVLLTFETDEERALFDDEPVLGVCVTTRELGPEDEDGRQEPGALVSASYAFEPSSTFEEIADLRAEVRALRTMVRDGRPE